MRRDAWARNVRLVLSFHEDTLESKSSYSFVIEAEFHPLFNQYAASRHAAPFSRENDDAGEYLK